MNVDLPLAPKTPLSVNVPLEFKRRWNGGIGHLHTNLAQEYRIVPITEGQARMKGRAALIPALNLGRYRIRAVVDWVAIKVETGSDQPAVNVHRWVCDATGESLSVTGPRGVKSHFGREFEVRIQEATPERVEAHLESIGGSPNLSHNHEIAAIEVSVDWYPKSRSERDRLLTTDLLWRHLLPPEDVWRRSMGTPRNFAGKEGGGGRPIPLLSYPSGRMRRGRFDYAGVLVKLAPDQIRDSAIRLHRQPAVDGTTYFGPRRGDAQIAIMHKVIDRQNRRTGAREELPEKHRRARVEVTLRGAALEELGIHEASDLIGFKFESLAVRYFRYWIPTVPFQHADPKEVAEVVRGARSRQEISVFGRTGVFGLELYQRARRRLSVVAQRKLKNRRGTRRERLRPGTGPKGFRNAFSEMEARIYDALRILSGAWVVK